MFNLQSALRLYDTIQEQIAAYEARLMEEIEAITPLERADAEVPPHPNPAKEQQIRRKGDLDLRTQLHRLSSVDLTRIDGIGPSTARTITTEIGFDLSAFPSEKHFVLVPIEPNPQPEQPEAQSG